MESLKLLDMDLSVDSKLSILILLADGRLEALRFAHANKDDIDKIKEEIAKYEAYTLKPRMLSGPMKLGAGPRTHRDGYLAALHEALALIES